MRFVITVGLALCVMLTLSTAMAAGGMRIGGGVHYVRTLGEIKDTPEVDENAFNLMGAIQFCGATISVEGDVEWIPDYLGSEESLLMPQAYLLLGNRIYAGAGIGIGYFDGEWFDDPFYALRAGIDIPLGTLHLDINANYRFMSSDVFDDVDESDLNSITFGAIAKFEF